MRKLHDADLSPLFAMIFVDFDHLSSSSYKLLLDSLKIDGLTNEIVEQTEGNQGLL